MSTANLTMHYGERAVRPAAAWYIPGADPAIWLDEVTAWNIDQPELRLLPIPRSISDRTPQGTLVVAPEATSAKVSQRCIPYGLLEDCLYLPVEARLKPEVSATELRGLLSDSNACVWHPTAGLVAIESGDVLRIVDLISLGPTSRVQWDAAVPGIALARRLTSLIPTRELSIEQILQEGQDDIGSESDAITKLPPSPAEPSSGAMSAAARQARRLAAQITHWFTQRAPVSGSVPTWVNRLEQWAERHLAGIAAGLSAERNKEVARLMHLLETDPDRGLRFALPLGGDAHRGRAAPGGRLGERDTNFSLGNLGGGQAADVWDLSTDYHYKLTARYRELANREIRLGRHRRAAYIFAELLHDFDAAAGALVEGRHWREAAVLYQQRLGRPRDAARCLEQGGLWMEAIALYENLESYEKAGDLYRQLDQVENAHEQYRKAVEQLRAANNRLGAARLLEQKLEAVDEAIDELVSGWPRTPQAVQCLRELFQLLGRIGRHDLAQEWVTRFREEATPGTERVELVDILADTAVNYPDRLVQARAADCTRAIVSRQAPVVSQRDCQTLMSAIGRLVPEDRLLGRDCQRFLQQRALERQETMPARNSRRTGPQLIHQFQLLDNEVRWAAATAIGKVIIAVGQAPDRLVAVRTDWTTVDCPKKTWKLEPGLSDSPIILAADPWHAGFVLVHVVGDLKLRNEIQFTPTDSLPYTTHVGSIRGMSPNVVAAARTFHGVTWLLEPRGEELTLIALGPDGEQVSTEAVPTPDASFDTIDYGVHLPVPLHARGDKVYVGFGKQLMLFNKTNEMEKLRFEQRIMSVVGSEPRTRTRIAVTFERGGSFFWDDLEGRESQTFGAELDSPLVGFNRGGFLIAATDGRCQVYSTHGRRMKFEGETVTAGSRPIAVLSGPKIDQFGIVTAGGEISVYELP